MKLCFLYVVENNISFTDRQFIVPCDNENIINLNIIEDLTPLISMSLTTILGSNPVVALFPEACITHGILEELRAGLYVRIGIDHVVTPTFVLIRSTFVRSMAGRLFVVP